MLAITSGRHRHTRKKHLQVPWILWKRNGYCREDFLPLISKYSACYLKKKKRLQFTLPLKENPGLLSPPQSPWGPMLDSLQFADASLVLGAPNCSRCPDVDPQCQAERTMPSPRPAARALASAALQRSDFHCCLWTSPPPLGTPGPLQHHSPSTSCPSLFSHPTPPM